IPGGQESAKRQKDEADKPKGVRTGQKSIEPINAAFSCTGAIRCCLAWAQQMAEAGADMLVGVLAEIGNLEVIAQEIVTVELYERVEIEQCLDAQSGSHHQREIIRQRSWVSEPPEERCHCPAENLKPGPGQGD